MKATLIKLLFFSILTLIFLSCKRRITCRDIKERYFSITEKLKSKEGSAFFLRVATICLWLEV